MIWNRDGKTWYSEELINDIKEIAQRVINADHCANCDGIGFDNGCGDMSCGTFASNIILELINNV